MKRLVIRLLAPTEDRSGHRTSAPDADWPGRHAVTFKTALLAVTAALALIGAAVIAVPSTADWLPGGIEFSIRGR